MTDFISILIVDDHPVYREGLAKLIRELSYIGYCDEAGNGLIALEKLATRSFDIVLLDISMPVMGGIEAAREIKKRYPDCLIIMSSMYKEEDQIVELMEIGIDAYILKGADKEEIDKALNSLVKNGRYYNPEVSGIWTKYLERSSGEKYIDGKKSLLSLREIEVIQLLCKGFSAKEIANKLFLAESTVNSHRHHIMKRIGVGKIGDLINYAIIHNIHKPG